MKCNLQQATSFWPLYSPGLITEISRIQSIAYDSISLHGIKALSDIKHSSISSKNWSGKNKYARKKTRQHVHHKARDEKQILLPPLNFHYLNQWMNHRAGDKFAKQGESERVCERRSKVVIKKERGGRKKEEEETEKQESQGQTERGMTGIMRRQAERKARGEETAPGLWVKVQVAKPKRNRDQRISALLCLGSNHSNRKPCPALASSEQQCTHAKTLHIRTYARTHAHTHTGHQNALLRQGWKEHLNILGQELQLKCENDN